ncbi:MAG: hypothetical protein KDE32_04935 [Novosphingobium sp.]|nr:hypothetical protein [Novosphingobium sp.]
MNLTVPDPRRPRVLRDFADKCSRAGPADEAELLREARIITRARYSPRMIEVMIAAGAGESAALAMIGKDVAWMLSKGAVDSCMASVILPGMTEEVTMQASTPALALLAAWASAALCLLDLAPAESVTPLRPEGARLH